MFYYAFVLDLEFTKDVSEEEFEKNVHIKYTRSFPRTLHNRGRDHFGYKSPFISSIDEPCVDMMLEVFVENYYPRLMAVKSYLDEKECEITFCIVYDDEDEEEDGEQFKGYSVTKKTIRLLADLGASLDYSVSIAKDIFDN